MARGTQSFNTNSICGRCGYAGSSGCPRGDADCNLFVKPPTAQEQLIRELTQELNRTMPDDWGVLLRKCQDTKNLSMNIYNIKEGGKQYYIGAIPEGMHVTTMLSYVHIFLNGRRHGRKEGRESLKKDWYDLMKPEDE